MRWSVVSGLTILAACSTLILVARAQVPPEPRAPLEPFMLRKLAHVHGLVDGLALADHDRIQHHAERLGLLSQESTWKVLQTADYVRESMAFQRSAGLIAESARQENLDGATLAYFQLTLSCVQCHEHLRDQAKNR